MKCLIVTTHQLNGSLCKLLARHVENKLNHMGHGVTTEDLYAVKFEPALTAAERESYYGDSYESSNVTEQANRLKEAEATSCYFQHGGLVSRLCSRGGSTESGGLESPLTTQVIMAQ